MSGAGRARSKTDPDASTDLYFGPTAPEGKESNWLQTNPDKGWFPILRLYNPLQPWFDKTWQPARSSPLPTEPNARASCRRALPRWCELTGPTVHR